MFGSSSGTRTAPWLSNQRTASSTALRTPGSTPSPKYSFGTPMRRPFISQRRSSAYSSLGRSTLVESRGSNPAITSSINARSAALFAIGPAWSSEEAKAMMP